ncbi:MAG: ABC transporter ATP-binding protein [Candidatus Caldarchaeum sp.]|nr:ABC transporter ATP-binding protein [Candidatus Caldarchaeum sp.]
MDKLIEVVDLVKQFGGIKAVWHCSFSVGKGEVLGVVGPNGSGKTTLINIMTGYYLPDGGKIILSGVDITGLDPAKIASMGVGRTFQMIRIFAKSTVYENVLIAASTYYRDLEEARKKTDEALKFVGLYGLRDEKAKNLSYGQQKLLEFVRVMVRNPQVIMLDEPASGINPVMLGKLAEFIKTLNQSGKTFIIVEHNVKFVRQLCPRVLVMHEGQVIADGTPEEVFAAPTVIGAYLGKFAAS